MASDAAIAAHKRFRHELDEAYRADRQKFDMAKFLHDHQLAKKTTLEAFTADDLELAASREGVIRLDDETGDIVFGIRDKCELRNDPNHMCMRDARFGLRNDKLGEIGLDGGMAWYEQGVEIYAAAHKIIGRLNRTFTNFMREAFTHRLEVLARARCGESFYQAEWRYRDVYPDSLASGKLGREEALALLRRVEPSIGVKGSHDDVDLARRWFIKIFGKEAAQRLGGYDSSSKPSDAFIETQGRGLEQLKELCANGNESVAAMSMIVVSLFRERKGRKLDGVYKETIALSEEIAREGIFHPGQAVALCKAFLRAGADSDAEAHARYRGLVFLPKAAIIACAGMDLWEIGFARRMARLCDMARDAGESPSGAGLCRLFAREILLCANALDMSAIPDAARYHRDLAAFAARAWRLLARAERAGASYAVLREDLKKIFRLCDLKMPKQMVDRCVECAYTPMPQSSTWRGLMKWVDAALVAHDIHVLERARLQEEKEGGVIEWKPQFPEEFAVGKFTIAEMSDSARLRLLGQDFNNCVGRRHMARDCAMGGLRIFTARAKGESAPGGMFSISINWAKGSAHRSDSAVRHGRGVSEANVREASLEVVNLMRAAMAPAPAD